MHKHIQCKQCLAPKRADTLDKDTGCCKVGKRGPCKAWQSTSMSVFDFPLGNNDLLGKRAQPPSNNKSLEQQVQEFKDYVNHDGDGFGDLVQPDATMADEPQP